VETQRGRGSRPRCDPRCSGLTYFVVPDWLPDEPLEPLELPEPPAPDWLPEEPAPPGLVELLPGLVELPLELPVPPPAALLPPCSVRGWLCLF
jgi:hypothetical protein